MVVVRICRYVAQARHTALRDSCVEGLQEATDIKPLLSEQYHHTLWHQDSLSFYSPNTQKNTLMTTFYYQLVPTVPTNQPHTYARTKVTYLPTCKSRMAYIDRYIDTYIHLVEDSN